MANSQIDIKRLSFPNADAQLLLGLKGDKGDTGDQGNKGDTGDTGNGIASITHTGTSGAVKTYTITFTDGTSQTYDVTDGEVTTEQMNTAIDNAVTDVKSDTNAVFKETLGVDYYKSLDAYSGNNSADSGVGYYPIVFSSRKIVGVISAIRLNVSHTGKLSIGYYDGSASSGDAFDVSKFVITNEINVNSLGEATINLETPFSIPDGAYLAFGASTDSLTWKYGGYGKEQGFVYKTDGSFTYSSSSISIDVYGYSDSARLDSMESSLQKVDDYLFGNQTTYIDGYSESNTTSGEYRTSPFVMMKDFNEDFYVTDFVVHVRAAGTITIGTIKKTDAESGATYDFNKLNIAQTTYVTATGLQTIHLKSSMKVSTDEYVFVGIPSDTAGHYYGSIGADRGFHYVQPALGTYGTSNSSVNVIIKGYPFPHDSLSELSSVYSNKTLSILGDSISTFSGYIPEGNATYYPAGTVQAVSDTWWHKLYTALGMTLNVNNSWSGSRVTTTAGETSAGCMTRCQSLGDNPDVIIVWMGINDFNNEVALGTYDGASAMPTATNTFREAYAIMLNKILTKYQTSEVWVCTLPQCERNAESGFPEINGNGVALAEFNKAIRELADAFGVKVLDHNKCGLTYQNMPTYNPDNLHPTALGHSLVANNDIRQMDNVVRTRY